MGTLPPPRFTTREFKPGDVDFCYGSIDGQLWRILDRIFELKLQFERTSEAVLQRKTFLRSRKIGICDIVDSAERAKIDASDLGMQNVKLRDLPAYIWQCPKVDTLIFTGGNSKNGPEYFFRKLLKERNQQLEVISDKVPRIHQFVLPITEGRNIEPNISEVRRIKTISLTAPSGAANRAVGSLQEYKDLKSLNPEFNTFDFRVMQYRDFF